MRVLGPLQPQEACIDISRREAKEEPREGGLSGITIGRRWPRHTNPSYELIVTAARNQSIRQRPIFLLPSPFPPPAC
eukprot:scaffold10161_cov134-Skeletonema_marinoi.AAC.1